ncbi:MAG TPA: NAD(P)H-hydrate dehydratase [Longimicrobiaceae bacterium]|nr:NAD(P)H-hydrate dehydratase [Longimicrobiaceae bacterium]
MTPARRAQVRPRAVTPALLRSLPLPRPDADGDKEERGRVLVAGGSRETPGALLLAGVAALRAGAGKLRMATAAGVATALAVAVPEARVVGLRETESGAVAPGAADTLVEPEESPDAVLIGPGMIDEETSGDFTRRLLAKLGGTAFVLDAAAMAWLGRWSDGLHSLGGRAVITPHAGELAGILGCDKEGVSADPLSAARRAADTLRCVVVLKGGETYVVSPSGESYRYSGGRVGLATSGSGDVLAGIIAGLAARGADPLRAALWGVAIHGAAGNVLARRVGPLGFLARELLDEVPGAMRRLSDA